jgi:AcrR family transcriptional regulator
VAARSVACSTVRAAWAALTLARSSIENGIENKPDFKDIYAFRIFNVSDAGDASQYSNTFEYLDTFYYYERVMTEALLTRKRLTREESRAQTRDRLLDAAYEIVVSNGIEEASIEDIAEAAGFSRGAFYSNFESKEVLLCALLERETEKGQEELRTLMSQAASPEELIQKARAYYVNLGANSQKCTFALAVRLYSMRHPSVRSHVNEMFRKDQAKIVHQVQAVYSASGVEPPCSAEIITFGLMGVAQGLCLTQVMDPDAISKEFLPHILETLFDRISGLGATPAETPLAPPASGRE